MTQLWSIFCFPSLLHPTPSPGICFIGHFCCHTYGAHPHAAMPYKLVSDVGSDFPHHPGSWQNGFSRLDFFTQIKTSEFPFTVFAFSKGQHLTVTESLKKIKSKGLGSLKSQCDVSGLLQTRCLCTMTHFYSWFSWSSVLQATASHQDLKPLHKQWFLCLLPPNPATPPVH